MDIVGTAHKISPVIMALNFMKAIFGGGKPSLPARVPTDEILPLHEFDGRMQVRSIIMGWTMRFDDILDADKLNVTLSRLLEIGAWRKLGGRLRERVSRSDPTQPKWKDSWGNRGI